MYLSIPPLFVKYKLLLINLVQAAKCEFREKGSVVPNRSMQGGCLQPILSCHLQRYRKVSHSGVFKSPETSNRLCGFKV